MDESNLDQFTFPLDENEELNAMVLTNLLNSGVEEALAKLSPAELIQLEKNVQKLKRAKNPAAVTPSGNRPKPAGGAASKKRRYEEGDVGEEGDELYELARAARPSGGQYMNLPASAPQIEYRDGIEWLHFTYSTKGHVQDYCIRSDIDVLSLDEIPDDFKNENCVYPRALVPREMYTGNRWEYETQVNDVAWKLTWRNPSVLCGKRGLIQRAVDSYRNRTSENRSRRVMRQEKMAASGVAPRRRTPEEYAAQVAAGPKTLTIPYTDKDGAQQKVKIRVDVEVVDMGEIDAEFRRANAVYPQAMTDRGAYVANDGRWEYENACNELAWKLAWLNAPKIAGRRNLLQKAVDAYQTRIEASERARRSMRRNMAQSQQMTQPDYATLAAMGALGMDPAAHFDEAYYGKSEEFSQMVASTLQQALTEQGAGAGGLMMAHHPAAAGMHMVMPGYHHHHHQAYPAYPGGPNEEEEDEEDEERPQVMNTAELLGPH